MFMLPSLRSTLNRYDEGMAVSTEYVLLLGVSLVVFSAMSIGCQSFYHTAEADARAQSTREIALYVSDTIYDVSTGDISVDRKIDLQGRVNGEAYVVYPDDDSICVMPAGGHGSVQRAPRLNKNKIKIEGFIMSEPTEHHISYDHATRTVMLS